MSTLQRIGNASNRHQGPFKRVLCVCQGGLLRSPTTAWVLSQDPYGYNTRSCGINPEYALIILDTALLAWAQEIVTVENEIEKYLKTITEKPIINLDIPDNYAYRDPKLIELIKNRYPIT